MKASILSATASASTTAKYRPSPLHLAYTHQPFPPAPASHVRAEPGPTTTPLKPPSPPPTTTITTPQPQPTVAAAVVPPSPTNPSPSPKEYSDVQFKVPTSVVRQKSLQPAASSPVGVTARPQHKEMAELARNGMEVSKSIPTSGGASEVMPAGFSSLPSIEVMDWDSVNGSSAGLQAGGPSSLQQSSLTPANTSTPHARMPTGDPRGFVEGVGVAETAGGGDGRGEGMVRQEMLQYEAQQQQQLQYGRAGDPQQVMQYCQQQPTSQQFPNNSTMVSPKESFKV